jgi:DNA polymerase III alpha subunit
MIREPKTKALIKNLDWVGLFQFEGHTMGILGKSVKPDNIEELILVNAG